MYAIIKCGGKQYKVSEGDILDIDYTGKAAKETLEITDVLAINNGELKTGDAVANAKVAVEFLQFLLTFHQTVLLLLSTVATQECIVFEFTLKLGHFVL